MGWRDTARNTRRALKTTVVARELWGQTNDPQDAHKALEAATYLMRFANSLYAQIASDIRAAEEAAHTLAHLDVVVDSWAAEHHREEPS